MLLPALHIGHLTAPIPIIQGGMGIGVSRAGLAAAVANEGGIGILSGAQMGFMEPDFKQHPLQANLRAMVSQIRKARKLSPNGIIGIAPIVSSAKAAHVICRLWDRHCNKAPDIIDSPVACPEGRLTTGSLKSLPAARSPFPAAIFA